MGSLCQAALRGPRQVLKYLARYTHRVAISNQRLIALEDGRVTFRWKNYALRALVKDPPPPDLKKAEGVHPALSAARNMLAQTFCQSADHFGFLASRGRRENIVICRQLLKATSSTVLADFAAPPGPSDEPENDTSDRCPRCKVGSMRMLELLLPQADVIVASAAVQLDTS